VIELRLYRDGGQTAADVAREVAGFLDRAERTLELRSTTSGSTARPPRS